MGDIDKKRVIMISLFMFVSFLLKPSNQLIKVVCFNDRKDSINTLTHKMELGSIEFYFSKKPILNFVPTKQKNQSVKQMIFIFPKATVDKGTFDKIAKNINQTRGQDYAVKIEQVQMPIQGIKFSITFNPKKIICEYRFFESIGANHGILFNFYNKELLNYIQSKDSYILQVT